MDDCPLDEPRVRDAPAAGRRRRGRAARLNVALTTIALAVPLLAPAASRGAGTAKVSILGRSVDGRAIQAIEVGDPGGTPVLVVGCTHGDEAAGIAVARRLATTSPTGIDLWIVPVLNPDGLAARTRGNAHTVDLNRNFPYRWRRLGGVFYSGPHPLSEPEARIAYHLVLRIRPLVSVWFHQHRNLVWASGGNRAVERRFAAVSGLPYHPLPALAGSAIDWQNHVLRGTTAFAAELPAGTPLRAAVRRYAAAVTAAARTAAATP